jgi:single-stranded-DNA-specific exonuclease
VPLVQHRIFLDIEKSVTGQRWVERLDVRTSNNALAMSQKFGVPDLVARIMAGRGVEEEDALRWLDPTIKDLMPDPLTVTELGVVAARLVKAIQARETVAIFGDYDVDGAASSALLSRYLSHFSVPHEIYIPDRIFEGYGPNPAAMEDLAKRGASLIITVDCGTNSAVAIAAGQAAGAQVIVIDHHQVGGALPEDTSVANPNREDDLSGLGYLCAAGVVFMVLVEVSRQLRGAGIKDLPDLMSMLDIVALATVCDVVPLIGLNRAFVVKGQQIARRLENPGLAALAKVAGVGEPLNNFHFGFVLGPRINAGGRIGDAALGARLLTLNDAGQATAIAEKLNHLNAERQAMEKIMLEAAEASVGFDLAGGDGPPVIIAADEKWHPGIVGLIAARLKEKARRPAFAIAFNPNGIGTGSGRSVIGIDLGRLVRKAVDLGILVKGGGHAMAAGITLEKAKLGDLRAFFEAETGAEMAALNADAALEIDGALSAGAASIGMIEQMEQAGPYGSGNPAPLLVLPNHRLAYCRVVGAGHVSMTLSALDQTSVQAIAFRAEGTPLGDFLQSNIGQQIHVAGNLSINHFNGRRTVQMRVVDAAAPSRF